MLSDLVKGAVARPTASGCETAVTRWWVWCWAQRGRAGRTCHANWTVGEPANCRCALYSDRWNGGVRLGEARPGGTAEKEADPSLIG